MNYLPIMRQQFEELLFHKDGPKVSEAIKLMDEYGLDRDDVFENFDEFLFNSKELKVKKFGDLDSNAKSAFTRAYNSMAHKAQGKLGIHHRVPTTAQIAPQKYKVRQLWDQTELYRVIF